jgi:hypothetical protein
MVPPRNVVLKVSNQFIRRCEHISALFPVEVPVISFSNLVIVAQNAFSMHDIRQPVLVIMLRPGKRLCEPPQHQLSES